MQKKKRLLKFLKRFSVVAMNIRGKDVKFHLKKMCAKATLCVYIISVLPMAVFGFERRRDFVPQTNDRNTNEMLNYVKLGHDCFIFAI